MGGGVPFSAQPHFGSGPAVCGAVSFSLGRFDRLFVVKTSTHHEVGTKELIPIPKRNIYSEVGNSKKAGE
jgi:hypothetical protein